MGRCHVYGIWLLLVMLEMESFSLRVEAVPFANRQIAGAEIRRGLLYLLQRRVPLQEAKSRAKRDMRGTSVCDMPEDDCPQEPFTYHCDNGGTCLSDKKCHRWCQCTVGFTGQHCEAPADVTGHVTEPPSGVRFDVSQGQDHSSSDKPRDSSVDVVTTTPPYLARADDRNTNSKVTDLGRKTVNSGEQIADDVTYVPEDLRNYKYEVERPNDYSASGYDDQSQDFSSLDNTRYFDDPSDSDHELCTVTERSDSAKGCGIVPCDNGYCVNTEVEMRGTNYAAISCRCDAGWGGQACTKCISLPQHVDEYDESATLTLSRAITPINNRDITTTKCDLIERLNNGCEHPAGSTPGYESPVTPLPCQHGVCYHDDNNRTQCVCDPGWVGDFCDTCCDLDCENNGTCEIHEGALRCVCDSGYGGERCQQVLPPETGQVTFTLRDFTVA